MIIPEYEVFAIKYGERVGTRGTIFVHGDPHDAPLAMDYYVWAVRSKDRTFVVDVGYGREEGERRGRKFLRCPTKGLALLDIDASKVADVIITHMHYDHAGTLHDFPRAKFHIQDLEINFATGRHMSEPTFRDFYSVRHVTRLIEFVYQDRVVFHDGDEIIAPGVVVHHLGGHTMGMQCVSVETKRGKIILAVDAAHFYENMEKPSPFPLVYSVADMLRGFHTMRAIAASPAHIIPGHDPLVLKRYPAPSKTLEGIVARLDVPPCE